jgi:hypothetical protein
LAAKSVRGSKNAPFTSDGKPYFFDVGTADHIATCYSCHPGGGPVEGIVNQDDNTVTPYTDPSLQPVHAFDRDFYSYDSNDLVKALYGPDMSSTAGIAETMADIGNPRLHDWSKTGSMEADCLVCHIDPQSKYTYVAADGLKVQPFRPRLMVFADRDETGKVQAISFGMPLKLGLENSSAMNYTDGLQRMMRPTSMMALGQLPKEIIGEMMQMWVDGLKQIEASGVALPYALYAGPQTVPKIWDPDTHMLVKAYCANPNGVMDEMKRLQQSGPALGMFFTKFLQYFKDKGLLPPDATMDDLMHLMFNDFIYAYQIKFNRPGTDMFLPLPFALRAYEPGKIYTDWDSCDASVRDYVRVGIIEGEGIPYTGLVGQEYSGLMYAMKLTMQGDYRYVDPATGQIDLSLVIRDIQNGVIPASEVQPTLHEHLPYFFDMMPTAGLMGLDFNHDGSPVTYVKIVRNGDDWQAKAYYNVSDLTADGSMPMDEMFGSHEDINSPKWIYVCGQCHVMTEDHGNSNWTRGRTYMLGMPADWVKNGNYIKMTNDPEAIGYDVHMSPGKMGCGTCHLRESGSKEDKHNFLKGVDTAHMVRNDLDANPKPKTCEGCHLNGDDPNAANPTAKHEEVFGENTGRHLAIISCQACHEPYRKTWRFRTFDDTLGYYTNFDNLMGYNVLADRESGIVGDGKGMAFPDPAYALQPVYGTSPGYGIPHFHMVSQAIDADGKGVQAMDFVSQMVNYFNMNGEADPGRLVNGMPTNFKFDFWNYFLQVTYLGYQQMGVPLTFNPQQPNLNYPPLYYGNGVNGYPQIVVGNPITIYTWVDVNPQPDADMSDLPYGGAKILYIRELNAIIKAYKRPCRVGVVSPMEMAMIPPNDPTWAENPNVGRVVLKDSGYVLFDHTGDMFPDIWWDEDVKAVQAALTTVLKAEGEVDPHPVMFIAGHYFSDSHGIKPAEKALGSKSCNDCHGSSATSAGAHRITDRNIVYIPWAPPWFTEANRFMKYNPDTGKMELVNPDGLFLVDGEIDYAVPMQANGLRFIGAKAEDVLELSHHHAEELFSLAAEGTVTGKNIPGIDPGMLTPEEQNTEYAKQVVNGPWGDKMYFYLPEPVKKHLAACGFLVGSGESIYLSGRGFVTARPVNFEFEAEEGETPTSIIRLPYSGTEPEIWRLGEHDTFYALDHEAEVVGYQGGYVLVKVTEPGEYIAVARGAGGGNDLLYDLWGAFAN